MARVKGRDVVVELMDSVAKLEATSALHAEQLESLAKHAIGTTATVTALGSEMRLIWRSVGELSKRMDDVSKRMDDVSKRMDDVSKRMDDVSKRMDGLAAATLSIADQLGGVTQRVGSLETELQAQASAFVDAAVTARTHQQQLGRFAKLISQFADGSSSRFDDIEDRLVKLERKAG
jgi:methyl-accepting chemotaxis protein